MTNLRAGRKTLVHRTAGNFHATHTIIKTLLISKCQVSPTYKWNRQESLPLRRILQQEAMRLHSLLRYCGVMNNQSKLILLIGGNVLPVFFFLQLMNSEATLPFDLPQPVYPLIPDHISGCIAEIHNKKSCKGKGQN